MVDFGERLKNLRKTAGLTQEALARQLNVSKSVVSYYELQERYPSPETLKKISEIFHVTTDFLLGIERKTLLDISGLDEEDVQLIMHTVKVLKNKNKQ